MVVPLAIVLLFGCSVEGGEEDPSELLETSDYASVWNEGSEALDDVGADFAIACNVADGDPERCAGLAEDAGQIVDDWIGSLEAAEVPASMEAGHGAAVASLAELSQAFRQFAASIDNSDASALRTAIDDLEVAFQELEAAYAMYPDAGLHLVVW